MLLYHGTTEAVARQALGEGLKPRGITKKRTNWTHVPSNSTTVYLTTTYACYFAMSATEPGERWGLIEVDTDKLNLQNMLPDEDWLEQGSRGQSLESIGMRPGLSMKQRTFWFRRRLKMFRHMWRDSLDGLGTCGHHGSLPPEAITRVAIYDPRSNPVITLSIDPMISIVNFKFVGEKYRGITRWLMGEAMTAEQMFWHVTMLPEDRREQLGAELADRSGLEILTPERRAS